MISSERMHAASSKAPKSERNSNRTCHNRKYIATDRRVILSKIHVRFRQASTPAIGCRRIPTLPQAVKDKERYNTTLKSSQERHLYSSQGLSLV